MLHRLTPPLVLVLGLTPVAPAGVVPLLPRPPAEVVAPADPGAEPEDPTALADRIAQNTKAAGDRLRDHDAGDDTRKTQDQILKDIDALLKQAENPPPMGGGGGGGGQPPPDGSDGGGSQQGGGQNPNGSGQKQSGGNAGGSGKKPSGGSSGGSGQKPSGGNSGKSNGPGQSGGGSKGSSGGQPQAGTAGGTPTPGGWRERRQAKGPGDPGPGKPGGTDPMPGGAGNPPPGEPGQPGGGVLGGGAGGKGTPALPFDDAITKQVWGHLPERLRQQMTQYYREQFVSKYGDLLRDYYSALAEREKTGKK